MRPFTGKLVKATKESYSPICFLSVLCKIHPHHPPPTQIVNSDNGLTLAFNSSPTKMTGDKNMPLDTIISTTYSRNYNSAYSTVSEAAFFLLSCLIFSSVFPWKINFWICKQKIIKLKILKSKRMKFDLQMTNHVFWHTSSIYRISPNEWKLHSLHG